MRTIVLTCDSLTVTLIDGILIDGILIGADGGTPRAGIDGLQTIRVIDGTRKNADFRQFARTIWQRIDFAAPVVESNIFG